MDPQQQLKLSLTLYPRHQQREQQSTTPPLDHVLDRHRAAHNMSGAELDAILMGYRYLYFFRAKLKLFSAKKIKPPYLEDLMLYVFSNGFCRDFPAKGSLTLAQDLGRKQFGSHAAGLLRAWASFIENNKAQWKKQLELNPTDILPQELQKRWAQYPQLLERSSLQVLTRPQAGVWSFDAHSDFKLRTVTELSGQNQSMDPGSWALCQYLGQFITKHISEKSAQNRQQTAFQVLDACAAPGGKSIALKVLCPSIELWSTDVSFKRLERLRENIQRWNLNIQSSLRDWSSPDPPEAQNQPEEAGRKDLPNTFDFILADLPCSGSGTLHTQPDLLSLQWTQRLKELQSLQLKIIRNLKAHLKSNATLWVSLCSVDPQECQAISNALNLEPVFCSWPQTPMPSQGLTAWIWRNVDAR